MLKIKLDFWRRFNAIAEMSSPTKARSCNLISTQVRTHFQRLPCISIPVLAIASEAENPGFKLSILFTLRILVSFRLETNLTS